MHITQLTYKTTFLRARRQLMHDLDGPSDAAAKRFLRLDLATEPESLNVCPETPQEEAGQEATDVTLLEYNQSTAASSGVDYGYIVPVLCGLGPPARNIFYWGVTPHHAHCCRVHHLF